MFERIKKTLSKWVKSPEKPYERIVPINSFKACQQCEINKLYISELKKRYKIEGLSPGDDVTIFNTPEQSEPISAKQGFIP